MANLEVFKSKKTTAEKLLGPSFAQLIPFPLSYDYPDHFLRKSKESPTYNHVICSVEFQKSDIAGLVNPFGSMTK